MKIINALPPNFSELESLLGIKKDDKIIYTYGDHIFNPTGVEITADLMEHESVHGEQQGHNDTVAKLWWKRYMEDKEFRIEQEVAAYGKQFKFICKTVKDRNKQERILNSIANIMASAMYGNIISAGKAKFKIREASLLNNKKLW